MLGSNVQCRQDPKTLSKAWKGVCVNFRETWQAILVTFEIVSEGGADLNNRADNSPGDRDSCCESGGNVQCRRGPKTLSRGCV